MPILNTLFGDNKFVHFAAVFAALLALALLLYLVWRFAFGRRLHLSGGRQRQPRLGVVDAYDLDRQRQLVLVRRDNVEHLIMIGGPNDVVIESAILRAQNPLVTREAAAPAIPEVSEPPPPPRPVVMPVQPQAEPRPSAPAKAAPPPVAPPAPLVRLAPEPAPSPPTPAAAVERPASNGAAEAPVAAKPRLDDVPAFLVEPRRTAPPAHNPPPSPSTPPLPAPTERKAPAMAAPGAAAEPAPQAPAPLPPDSARLISSLEDEMARLLGRPPKT